MSAKVPQEAAPRKSGQAVTDPRQLMAIALKNSADTNNQIAPPSPLTTAINKRRKKF